MDPEEINLLAASLTIRYQHLLSKVPVVQDNGELKSRIEGGIQLMEQHQNDDLQLYALTIIPVDMIHERIADRQTQNADESFEVSLLRALLTWFKNEFMTWVNTLSCSRCKSENTKSSGATQPTSFEREGLANIVELHKCQDCGHTTRFPRYNSARTLLTTRSGRCGEWANLFTLIARAMGLEVRYIIDLSDHVWTEVKLEGFGPDARWIHCDSCEESFNQPHLYEVSWGKRLNYVIAIGDFDCVDVTQRYTIKYSEVCLSRKLIPEEKLKDLIQGFKARVRIRASPSLQIELQKMDERELIELNETCFIDYKVLDVGRQSGSLEWRQSRGEI